MYVRTGRPNDRTPCAHGSDKKGDARYICVQSIQQIGFCPVSCFVLIVTKALMTSKSWHCRDSLDPLDNARILRVLLAAVLPLIIKICHLHKIDMNRKFPGILPWMKFSVLDLQSRLTKENCPLILICLAGNNWFSFLPVACNRLTDFPTKAWQGKTYCFLHAYLYIQSHMFSHCVWRPVFDHNV